jgi:excisionase family DNA binding protein
MLSLREVAEQYGVCRKTISRWIKREGLPVHRVGRIVRVAEADAVAFMASRRA